MITRPFELRVIAVVHRSEGRDRQGEYGLALSQQPIRLPDRGRGQAAAGGSHEGSSQLVVRIWGTAFQAAVDRILAALKDNGYRASELSRARRHLSTSLKSPASVLAFSSWQSSPCGNSPASKRSAARSGPWVPKKPTTGSASAPIPGRSRGQAI